MTLEMSPITSSDKGFDRLAQFTHQNAGLVLQPGKRTMIESRLRHRMKEVGVNTLSDYCDILEQDSLNAEIPNMISALTTNVSGFFRENHHFELLKANVVNLIKDSIEKSAEALIWSAGCSNGQEAYSIAMTLEDAGLGLNTNKIKILATDIDQEVVAYAREGVYTSSQMSNLSHSQKSQYFTQLSEKKGDDVLYQINEKIRSRVHFKRLNLMEKWPMRKKFAAIFCRNVVIYFDQATQDKLWPRFHSSVVDGGFLFVGHSERVTHPGFSPIGETAYKST